MQTPDGGHEVIVVDTSDDSEQGSDGEGGDDAGGAAARDADAPASDEDGTDDDEEEAHGSVYSPSEFAVESEEEEDDYDMDSDDDLDRNAGFGYGGSANGPIREGPARCVTRSAAAGQQATRATRAPRRQSRRVAAAAAAVAGAGVAASARAKGKAAVAPAEAKPASKRKRGAARKLLPDSQTEAAAAGPADGAAQDGQAADGAAVVAVAAPKKKRGRKPKAAIGAGADAGGGGAAAAAHGDMQAERRKKQSEPYQGHRIFAGVPPFPNADGVDMRRKSCHVCTQCLASWRGALDLQLACSTCPRLWCSRCLYNRMGFREPTYSPSVRLWVANQQVQGNWSCPVCDGSCPCVNKSTIAEKHQAHCQALWVGATGGRRPSEGGRSLGESYKLMWRPPVKSQPGASAAEAGAGHLSLDQPAPPYHVPPAVLIARYGNPPPLPQPWGPGVAATASAAGSAPAQPLALMPPQHPQPAAPQAPMLPAAPAAAAGKKKAKTAAQASQQQCVFHAKDEPAAANAAVPAMPAPVAPTSAAPASAGRAETRVTAFDVEVSWPVSPLDAEQPGPAPVDQPRNPPAEPAAPPAPPASASDVPMQLMSAAGPLPEHFSHATLLPPPGLSSPESFLDASVVLYAHECRTWYRGTVIEYCAARRKHRVKLLASFTQWVRLPDATGCVRFLD